MRTIILLLVLINAINVSAQTHYRQFLKDGKVWVCNRATYRIDGDTLINDVSYMKSYRQSSPEFGQSGYIGALRETDYEVFIIWAGDTSESYLYDYSLKPEEQVLFRSVYSVAMQGEPKPFFWNNQMLTTVPVIIESTNSTYASWDWHWWVPGVGCNNGPFSYGDYSPGLTNETLQKCYEDGTCIFTANDFKALSNMYILDGSKEEQEQGDYRPLLRRNKYWEGTVSTSQDSKPLSYFLSGDTVINDELYSRCFCGQIDNAEAQTFYYGAFQEKDRRVYMYDIVTLEKRLLFDFNLKVGDEFGLADGNPCEYIVKKGHGKLDLRVMDISKVEDANGKEIRRFHLRSTSSNPETNNQNVYWTEGVGKDYVINDSECWRSDIWNWRIGEESGKSYSLLGCYEGGQVIYPKNETDVITNPNGAMLKANNLLFDLQGRRINGEPKRGLYIRDGKKVIK